MNDEVIDLSFVWDFFDKVFYKIIGIKLVDAESAFDGAINVISVDGLSDGSHTVSN